MVTSTNTSTITNTKLAVAALTLVISGGLAIAAGGAWQPNTETKSYTVDVYSCINMNDLGYGYNPGGTGGILVKRSKTTKEYLPMSNGCKVGGWGEQNYTYTCLSRTKFKITWQPCLYNFCVDGDVLYKDQDEFYKYYNKNNATVYVTDKKQNVGNLEALAGLVDEKQDECKSDTVVTEQLCKSNTEIFGYDYQCPSGDQCVDGACKKVEVVTSTPEVTTSTPPATNFLQVGKITSEPSILHNGKNEIARFQLFSDNAVKINSFNLTTFINTGSKCSYDNWYVDITSLPVTDFFGPFQGKATNNNTILKTGDKIQFTNLGLSFPTYKEIRFVIYATVNNANGEACSGETGISFDCYCNIGLSFQNKEDFDVINSVTGEKIENFPGLPVYAQIINN